MAIESAAEETPIRDGDPGGTANGGTAGGTASGGTAGGTASGGTVDGTVSGGTIDGTVSGGTIGVLSWPGTWRVYITARTEEIRADAARAAAARGEVAGLGVVLRALTAHLDTAEAYAQCRQGFRRWLTGQAVEGAWSNVYTATVLLFGLLPSEELISRVHEVMATGRAYLTPDDPRLTQLGARVAAGDIGEADRPLLQSVLRAAYTASSLESGRVRSFRNLLFGGIVSLTVMVTGLILVGAVWPMAIPMCGNQAVVVSQGLRPNQICPTGGSHPRWGDLPLVGLIGMLGAALATATSLSSRTELATRYSLAVAQNLLKVPAGVATAVLGLLLLNSGFVPGFTGLSSQPAILVWALVFGYAQQIVTRLVDQRADNLISAASPITSVTPAQRTG